MRGRSVRLLVSNETGTPTNLVLEPWGEIVRLEPGETRDIVYRGDSEPRIAIQSGPGELKLWAEGDGVFDVR